MATPVPRRREVGDEHDATTPESAPASPLFSGTPRFRLRQVLGEGGMGVVYDAWDTERAMPVALKTMRHLDADSLVRLKTEFRAHADLEHRNLVRLGELHHHNGHWFFTMELVEGRTFLEWVAPDDLQDVTRSGELPLDGRRRIYDDARLRSGLRQLAHGLDALHRIGKVHRDLKPSNVLVTSKDRVVILDLGLVADRSPELSDRNVVGTAAYIAPEQARSGAIGPASDWYSVGVMLYEALTGRLPVDGTPLEILLRKQSERPVSPAALADVAPDLAELCLDLLALDPAARPDGAAVLRRLAAPGPAVEEASAFVGRTLELRVLDDAWAEVRRGGTVTVRLEGASGIGKTALVRQFVDETVRKHAGALVLEGRCHERENVPFKGLDGVVDALARALHRVAVADNVLPAGEAAALAQVFPVLLRVPAIARSTAPVPDSPLELRARAFRGLRRILRALAVVRPLAITIDDIQWADADCLTLLREILHAPGAPQLLLIVTWRGAGAPPALPGTIRSLRLDRLSPEEAEVLIALVAPARTAEAAALAASSDGHPMFLRELLRHTAPPRGTRLDDALWARIARMEKTARRMLELVAIAGRPLPQALIADALGLDMRTCAKWLAVLRAASLVRTGGARGSDPVEPYHDRVRDAVQSRIAPARRRRYHGRLATSLIAGGLADKDPLAVVLHLEAAGQLPQAAALARRAARRADRPPAFEQLAALCDAALRLGDHRDPETVRDLLIKRADALACAGRGPEAAEAYLRAADQLAGDDAFVCRRSAAEQLLISGHVARGLALLREVTTAIGEPFPASTAAARRLLVRRWLWLSLRGTRFKRRSLDDAPRSELRHFDICRSASLGLCLIDPVMGATFGAEGLMTALRLGDPRRISYALASHATFVAALGDRHARRARLLIAQARELGEQQQSRFLLGWARACEGVVDYFCGDLLRSVDTLVDAEEQLRNNTVGTAGELAHLRMFLLFSLRRHGAYGELRTRLDEYVRDALRRGDRYAANSYRWIGNLVWLAGDDPERAHADLDAATWSPREDGIHLQHWFQARARAELALYEDDPAALAALEDDLPRFLETRVLAHVQVVRFETALGLTRIAIRRGDAAAARRNLARMRNDQTSYLRAMATLCDAAVADLEGRRPAARALLERLVATTGKDLPVAAALARRRLGAITAGAAGQRLIAEADAMLMHHGVVAPARFARAFATWPGAE